VKRKNRPGKFTPGLFYFAKHVPAPGSAQFNFTFDFSGGVLRFSRARAEPSH
jgi:hypothetical protein